MFFLLDLPPAQVEQTAIVRPAPAAQAAPPPAVAPAAPAMSRQEVDSHGWHYIVVGNTLLAPAELQRALEAGDAPQSAISALKKAYEAKGYFLVALVAQAQDKNKQVWLQVVQGRLTHVNGPRDLVGYFSGLKGDSELRTSDVIRRSTLAQAYAATNGQQPQISFKPAPEVGGSAMEISQTPVPGARAFGGSLTTGNFGNRYAGHYLAQAQAYAQHDGFTLQVNHSRALTGLDENTHGAYYAATSANLTAITPLGTFQADSSATDYQLGKKFAPLYPAGKIKVFGLSANQLLYADDTHRWSIKQGLHHIRDTGTVFNNAFTLRDQKYNVLDLGSDYSMRFAGWSGRPASLSLSGTVKLGSARGDSGFEHGEGRPTGHFQVYTASADLTQTLPRDYSVQFSMSGQSSPDILPSYQQWVLGGLNNLTAWLPGTIVGDRGYLGRATVQGPQWKAGPLQLRPSVFAEYGAARYSYITAGSPTWQSLSDVGASLNLSLPGARTSAILAYAKPLGSRHVPSATEHGQQAHTFFYVQIAL
jgi:hemolysin activation/secretion protein